jgi:3-oxoacyl-[acyl-carrier-protein] synthase-1
MPAITGIGVTSALGAGAAQACAALRAGLGRVAESDLFVVLPLDPEGDPEPLMAAPVPTVNARPRAAERIPSLALPALAESLADAGLRREDVPRASLHLALPGASRPGLGGLDPSLADELCRRGGIPRFGFVTASRAGHSGVVEAMDSALEFLRKEREGYAVVLAVDSLLDRETFRWLDKRDRLKGSRNPEGIAVGEAAVALVVERTRHAEGRGARLWATVDATGTAREKATIFGDGPGVGDGLTRALRVALQGLPAPPAPAWVLTDHNGERYRAIELGYVINRVNEVFPELRYTWYVADGVGDTGAAAGGLLAARAAHAFACGHAPAGQAMILTSSDDGGRGVLVLGTPAPGGN